MYNSNAYGTPWGLRRGPQQQLDTPLPQRDVADNLQLVLAATFIFSVLLIFYASYWDDVFLIFVLLVMILVQSLVLCIPVAVQPGMQDIHMRAYLQQNTRMGLEFADSPYERGLYLQPPPASNTPLQL